MIKLITFLEKWLNKISDPKQRRLFFSSGLVIIYFVWFFLLLNPARIDKYKLKNQIQFLQTQIVETQQQIDTLSQVIKTESIAKVTMEQQQLSAKIQSVEQRLDKTSPLFISEEEWITLKKSIISQQANIDSSITLISISDLPLQPWAALVTQSPVMKNASVDDINLHALEVKFQADYFSTIQYLSRLEKLPWRIYWDSLQYRVEAYPKGDVIIRFHVFTKQQSVA